MQGHRIELTVQDIYFLTGLPPLGMVGNTQPILPCGQNIIEFLERHFRLGLQVKGTRIPIGDLERLETRAVDPRQPGTPSHHRGSNDACGECFEWDLLWVGPDDAVVVEMKIFAMQAASEP